MAQGYLVSFHPTSFAGWFRVFYTIFRFFRSFSGRINLVSAGCYIKEKAGQRHQTKATGLGTLKVEFAYERLKRQTECWASGELLWTLVGTTAPSIEKTTKILKKHFGFVPR